MKNLVRKFRSLLGPAPHADPRKIEPGTVVIVDDQALVITGIIPAGQLPALRAAIEREGRRLAEQAKAAKHPYTMKPSVN